MNLLAFTGSIYVLQIDDRADKSQRNHRIMLTLIA
jgi:ABC-type protease/lipase transport system fused ATPase/permease subunit